MKKTILLILISTLLLFIFTGCDSVKGIDRYYFATALGIDKSENNLLKLSLQISSTNSESKNGSSSSSQSSEYKIYSVEARTIDEGISILNNFLNKQINLSHCSALVISEEIAKAGIRTHFNTLSNNTELRHSCKIIVSSKTAYDVLDKISKSGEAFSSRLFDSLTNSSDYSGFTIKSTFGTFFQELHNNYFEPSVIYVSVNDDILQANGIAIFKDEYMVGHVDAIDSIAQLILTNELDSCIITLDNVLDSNEKIDLELSLYKKTHFSIDIINGSPFISVTIYPEGNIRGSGSTFNYTNSNNLKSIESLTNNYLTDLIKNYLYEITKDYNSDVIGIKGIYESEFLTREEFDKIHWDDIFKDSFYDVTVKTQLNSSNLFNKE